MIILTVSVTGCHKNENPTEIPQDIVNTESMVSAEADSYSYHGAKLSGIQRQNMGNGMDKMVKAVIDAVNTSQEQVDLSVYSQKSQIAWGTLQIAAYIDPITEIAAFEEDNSAPCVFKIDYGCSIGEHQSLVAEFNEKIEGIVNNCMAGARSDTEYAAAVFQYLVSHCRYDYGSYADAREAGITAKESTLRYSQMSVYGVLMDGSGVCQQFTRAFSLLLQQKDIPALEIAAVSNVPFASNNAIYNGKTEGELFGINHMWNLMQLSGKWYGADVTFAVSEKEESADALEAGIYQYFGMNDAVMQSNFPSDISLSAIYRGMDIPSCEEELMLPEKEKIGEAIPIETAEAEDGLIEKRPVAYEMEHLQEAGSEEILRIDFGDTGAVYRLTVTLPEGYIRENAYPICYLFGKDADVGSVDLSSETICVKVSVEAEGTESDPNILEECDFSREPAVFLNRFLFGIIEAIEGEYSADPFDRTLCGENLGANMCLYLLFQSDNLAQDVFAHYICVDPNLYYEAGDRSLMAWEAEYFQRCQELPVSLTIKENQAVDTGRNTRTGLLKDIIKKREYKNLILE